MITLSTSLGNIVLELDADKAPITVENFLSYAKSGYYNGTIFHRVIDGFMIQGGGFDSSMKQKSTENPIKNEANNGLKNNKYTIAMARTSIPDSATSQFFINVNNNDFLNYPGQDGWGYCVFGKVTAGTDVVDKIQKARGKGSIFGEPDEVVSKTNSTDMPPVTGNQSLKLGQTVRAPDRNNVGTVMSIDEGSGTAILRFVNKKNGTTATKKFTLDELQPPKAGQAKQTPFKIKSDASAKQSSEIKFIVVGSSSYDKELKNLSIINDVQNFISFEGWKHENTFQSYLSICDIGISPLESNIHHDTTYANKIFQYMSFGCPMICSNVVAQKEIIEK